MTDQNKVEDQKANESSLVSQRVTKRSSYSWLKRTVLALSSFVFTVLILLVSVLFWGLSTTAGAQFLLEQGVRLAGGQVTVQKLEGSVLEGLSVADLRLQLKSLDLDLEHAFITVNASRFWHDQVIHVSRSEAQRLYLNIKPSEEPSKTPESIALPFNIQIDALRVQTLEVANEGVLLPIQGANIDVKVIGGTKNYQVTVRSVAALAKDAEVRAAATATVAVQKPFRTTFNAQAKVRQEQHHASLTMDATGSIYDANISLSGQGEGLGVNGRAHLNLKNDFPLDDYELRVEGINPHAWGFINQHAELALEAKGQSSSKANVWWLTHQLSLTNKQVGRLDQNRLPLARIQANVTHPLTNIKRITLPSFAINLAAQGVLSGNLTIDVDPMQVQGDINLSRLNVASLHQAAPITDLMGRVTLRATTAKQVFDVAIQDRSFSRGMRVLANGQVFNQRLTLDTFSARLGDSHLSGRGFYELSGVHAFDFSAQLEQFVLDQWWQVADLPSSQISASVQARGDLQSGLNVVGAFNIANGSTWNKYPLSGNANLQVERSQLRHIDTQLVVGHNSLFAKGALGRLQDTLILNVAADELRELGPSLGGKFYLKGNLAGNLTSPSASLLVDGAKLKLPGQVSLAKLDGGIDIDGSKASASIVDGRLAIKNLAHRPSRFLAREATLKADGSLDQHTISLLGDFSLAGYRGAKLNLASTFKGAWSTMAQRPGWRGELASLDLKSKWYSVNLRKSLPLELLPPTAGKGFYAELGATQIGIRLTEGQGSRIEHEKTVWNGGQWQSKGSLTGVAWLPNLSLLVAEGVLPRRGAGLIMDGLWDLQFTDALEGRIQTQRRSGDLWIPNEPPVPMGLSNVNLEFIAKRVSAGRSRLSLDVDVQGSGFGMLKANAGADILADGMTFSLDTERQAYVNADMDVKDIGWTALLAGDDVALGGGLQGSVNVRHEANRWVSSGSLQSDDLRVLMIDQGIRLLNGRLRLNLRNETLELERLRFPTVIRVTPKDNRVKAWTENKDHQNGYFDVSGLWSLATHSGQLKVGAHHFPMVQRSDRFVVVSGTSDIQLSPTAVSIDGRFDTDVAWIDFGTDSPSRVSDDVYIRAPNDSAPSRTSPLAVSLNVQVGLGEAFYLQGLGLQTQIAGRLAITRENNELRARGEVRARNGRYRFVGQELVVRRGVVTFQGPLDNPLLDIVAVRQNTAVVAGVRIRGTAKRFNIELFSDPSLSDVEILSWLVLGRGPDEGGADLAFLVGVAGSVFGVDTSDGVKKFLGLDELGIRTGNISQGRGLTPENTVAGDSTSSNGLQAGEFFVIGKNFSESSSVTYQQALAGSEGVLLFSYRISDRLSLIARGGTVNGLELLYNLFFDD